MDWRATTLDDVRELTFPAFDEASGLLVPIEGETHVPFPIARVFMIYPVPGNLPRGSHTLLRCQQVVVCQAGRCDLLCDDGRTSRTYTLDSPERGVYVPPGVWRELSGFMDGTAIAVLCDRRYDPDDYITDLDEFRRRKTPASAAAGAES